MAGHHYDGHTGMLADLTGCKSSWMLLASETLNVIHVSTHVSLKDAIARATPQRIYETIRTGHRHFLRMGVGEPADRGCRYQSPLRRKRSVWQGRRSSACARHRAGPRRGYQRRRTDFSRHGVLPCSSRCVRSDRGPIPRPGTHPDQAHCLRQRRQRLAWPADRSRLGRPRHGLRHRRHRPRPITPTCVPPWPMPTELARSPSTRRPTARPDALLRPRGPCNALATAPTP